MRVKKSSSLYHAYAWPQNASAESKLRLSLSSRQDHDKENTVFDSDLSTVSSTTTLTTKFTRLLHGTSRFVNEHNGITIVQKNQDINLLDSLFVHSKIILVNTELFQLTILFNWISIPFKSHFCKFRTILFYFVTLQHIYKILPTIS